MTPTPCCSSRPVKNAGIVMITADKGLCGSMNTNVIRRTTRFMLDEAPPAGLRPGDGGPQRPRLHGPLRPARDRRVRQLRRPPKRPTTHADRPGDHGRVCRAAAIDAVYLIYSEFVNTLIQRPVVVPLLPLAARGSHRPAPASTSTSRARPWCCPNWCRATSRPASIRRCLSRSPASRAPSWWPCGTPRKTPKNGVGTYAVVQQAAPGQHHPGTDRNRGRRGGDRQG